MHKFSFFSTQTDELGSIRFKILVKNTLSAIYVNCLVDIFYPETCIGCGRVLYRPSRLICPVCSCDLPRCEFCFFKDNRAEMLFKGRVDLQSVASLYYFRKKGIVQKMMHALKYGGRQDVGEFLGWALAAEMVSAGRFREIDLVLPVPLHPAKRRKRGYNQVSGFGRVLSESLGVPFREDILERRIPGRSQTRKDRVMRNRALMDSFRISKSNELINKHVLIVDDIITSGATLEACARVILPVPGARVSLASMAFTL